MLGANPVKINPVRATCMKLKGTNHGLQEINDTCFNVCAAFSGTNNAYDVEPWCAKMCENLVEERKKQQYGVGSCDHQAPYRPVIWDQVPHFVPRLLEQGVPLTQLKSTCKKLCNSQVPNLSLECHETCDTDFNAIEPFQQNKIQPKMSIPELKKKHPTIFWIGITIISLGIIILLIALYKKYRH